MTEYCFWDFIAHQAEQKILSSFSVGNSKYKLVAIEPSIRLNPFVFLLAHRSKESFFLEQFQLQVTFRTTLDGYAVIAFSYFQIKEWQNDRHLSCYWCTNLDLVQKDRNWFNPLFKTTFFSLQFNNNLSNGIFQFLMLMFLGLVGIAATNNENQKALTQFLEESREWVCFA